MTKTNKNNAKSEANNTKNPKPLNPKITAALVVAAVASGSLSVLAASSVEPVLGRIILPGL